jgi:cryptochrome
VFYCSFVYDEIQSVDTCLISSSQGTKLVGYNRMKFLLESLSDLDEQLKQFGAPGLFIFKGSPTKIFRKMHEEFSINKLCFEQDCEPIWNERDEKVRELCHELQIKVYEKVSHTLYDPMQVIQVNGGMQTYLFK